ncbi:aldolase/citrate lyase family protein [Shewanella sp. AS16]|uniref:HpcH/HpaI aldolase family protein n=1 Tax=Shewanella sp. AS16 TaxID=2907625 RepID=UPI001F2B58FD|nr:aldolase/citrate lyase family protein [Shewanella sp. AS16]MCE9686861.1 aldolase/citrate lyase family protein [Shewanella sp. AS16]
MLGTNSLKAKLAGNEVVFGMLNSVPTPVVIEMLACAGYDFVLLDTEHVLHGDENLAHCIRAAESAGITPLVRVADANPAVIGRLLDAGAQGIVVSRVTDVDTARLAIAASKYPPLGHRGISGGRNTGFGTLPLADYITLANRETFVGLMIEDPQGLAALGDMLQLGHIDMIFEGALDLSLAMGHGIDFGHAQVQQSLQDMAEHCARARVPFCAIPRLPGQKPKWQRQGVNAFLVGEDRGLIFKQFKQQLQNLIHEK